MNCVKIFDTTLRDGEQSPGCSMGGNAIDAFGVPLPDSSLQTCLASDSVLLGAVGGPKWDAVPSENRPERGLLKLRSAMHLAITAISGSLKPREVTVGVPTRMPLVTKGFSGSLGMAFLLTVMHTDSRRCSISLPVIWKFRTSTSIR